MDEWGYAASHDRIVANWKSQAAFETAQDSLDFRGICHMNRTKVLDSGGLLEKPQKQANKTGRDYARERSIVTVYFAEEGIYCTFEVFDTSSNLKAVRIVDGHSMHWVADKLQCGIRERRRCPALRIYFRRTRLIEYKCERIVYLLRHWFHDPIRGVNSS